MHPHECDAIRSLDRAIGSSDKKSIGERRRKYLVGYPAAKAASRFNERLQHRLEIKGRAADDLEDVGGGGLLLQRSASWRETPPS
jgi:hypothetical protein